MICITFSPRDKTLKKVCPLFLVPCGKRLCSSNARKRKRRNALFLRSLGGAVFVYSHPIIKQNATLFVFQKEI